MTQAKKIGDWKLPEACIACGSENKYRRELTSTDKVFRGENFTVKHHHWRCTSCNVAILGDQEIDEAMRALVSAHQEAQGLLTAKQIQLGRKAKSWTQQQLAEASELGLATIKRLEGGCVVQTRANDTAIKGALQKAGPSNWITAAGRFSVTILPILPRNPIRPAVVFRHIPQASAQFSL